MVTSTTAVNQQIGHVNRVFNMLELRFQGKKQRVSLLAPLSECFRGGSSDGRHLEATCRGNEGVGG